MKKILFILAFINLGNSLLNAQDLDDLKSKYNNQTIYRYGQYFMKGTERLSFNDLRNEFSMSELGLISYEQARKYKTTGFVFRLISLGAMVVGFALVSDNTVNYDQRTAIYCSLGGQFLTAMISGKYYQSSMQSLDKAIWQRNKDLLFPAR